MPKSKPDPNRPRRWDMLIKRIPKDRPIIGAEIGVWMGATAQQVLAQLPLVTWYMIDAWAKPAASSTYCSTPDTIARQEQSYFDECYEKTIAAVREFGDSARIIREWSWNAVEHFSDEFFDVVFVDSDHSYEGVKGEIERWLPKVKPGGMISGHDYGNLPRYPGVKVAVDEFFAGKGLEIDGDCTWFVRLP